MLSSNRLRKGAMWFNDPLGGIESPLSFKALLRQLNHWSWNICLILSQILDFTSIRLSLDTSGKKINKTRTQRSLCITKLKPLFYLQCWFMANFHSLTLWAQNTTTTSYSKLRILIFESAGTNQSNYQHSTFMQSCLYEQTVATISLQTCISSQCQVSLFEKKR